MDPPTLPSLTVLIDLVEAGNLFCKETKCQQRVAQLINMAYYYLLRVGEYTKPRKKMRTVQFRMKDIAFWRNGFKIDHRHASLDTLLKCDGATLRLSNQKNGRKNKTIFQEANDTTTCPIKNLAHLVADINSFTADKNELL